MSDEKELKIARNVYKSLCAMFDEKGAEYQKDEEELSVSLMVGGSELPIHIMFNVNAKNELVGLLSILPCVFEQDKREACAIAVARANECLINGNFDFYYTQGMVAFRMATSFADSIISKEVYEYMFETALITVDKYNAKFHKLSKGMISLEDFKD